MSDLNIFTILKGVVEKEEWNEDFKEIWNYDLLYYFLSMYPDNISILNIIQEMLGYDTEPKIVYSILQQYIPYYNTRYNFIKLDSYNYQEIKELAIKLNIPLSDLKYLPQEDINYLKQFLIKG